MLHRIKSIFVNYIFVAFGVFILANIYLFCLFLFALFSGSLFYPLQTSTSSYFFYRNIMLILDFVIPLAITIFLVYKFKRCLKEIIADFSIKIVVKYLILFLIIYFAYSIWAYQGWWEGEGVHQYNSQYWYLINRTNPIYPFDKVGWAIVSSTSAIPQGYLAVPNPIYPTQNSMNNIVTPNAWFYFIFISLVQSAVVLALLNKYRNKHILKKFFPFV